MPTLRAVRKIRNFSIIAAMLIFCNALLQNSRFHDLFANESVCLGAESSGREVPIEKQDNLEASLESSNHLTLSFREQNIAYAISILAHVYPSQSHRFYLRV